MAKSLALLALRITTGILLVMWGAIKIGAPESAIRVSKTYYGDILSAGALQTPLGAAQIALGLLVILGLGRRFAYPLQAIVLGLGTAAIWKYLADPLGLWLLNEETRNPLFFPSSTVFVATIILLLFKSDDRLALDSLFARKK
jgi:putative oxidoreductase